MVTISMADNFSFISPPIEKCSNNSRIAEDATGILSTFQSALEVIHIENQVRPERVGSAGHSFDISAELSKRLTSLAPKSLELVHEFARDYARYRTENAANHGITKQVLIDRDLPRLRDSLGPSFGLEIAKMVCRLVDKDIDQAATLSLSRT
jgi:hypothetical protein